MIRRLLHVCHTPVRRGVIRSAAVLLFCLSARAASAQYICAEAPNDGVTPASDAINTCLQQHQSVRLLPGNYRITDTIRVGQHNAELASADGYYWAFLMADLGLVGDVVFGGNNQANNYSIHHIYIGGNLDNGRPCIEGQGANLRASGSGFSIYNVASAWSPCANFQIGGSNFSVHHNWLYRAGTPWPYGPVGDGLGVFAGPGGEVYENDIEEATDIALLAWGGSRHFYNNRVRNFEVKCLAGFNVGSENGGDHWGGVYEGNTVESGMNQIVIGILIGSHPWEPSVGVYNAGTVINNSSTGAIINMVVEGIEDIQAMYGNSTSGAQGDQSTAANCHGHEYTANHFNNAAIQPGATPLQYDGGINGTACVLLEATATVYWDIWYSGWSTSFSGDVSFVGWDWNDQISSIRVPAGRTVEIYQHWNFEGQMLTLTSDADDLRDFTGPGPDGTWNDAVSSIRIR